ncbi:hypothetical protein [Aliivibrio fischeri]|uniref:Uncharacterized protein n=1 Tax=Aliivibrio fischeri SR5 TaxID=1088719 RepID=A0AAV3EMM6_ALIFS|nr:hypothetical protein [Aliivibrio fischeri]EHN68016.1 hypothetical protein VFSR5_2741 [Aliivibrio fischeri SR5]
MNDSIDLIQTARAFVEKHKNATLPKFSSFDTFVSKYVRVCSYGVNSNELMGIAKVLKEDLTYIYWYEEIFHIPIGKKCLFPYGLGLEHRAFICDSFLKTIIKYKDLFKCKESGAAHIVQNELIYGLYLISDWLIRGVLDCSKENPYFVLLDCDDNTVVRT